MKRLNYLVITILLSVTFSCGETKTSNNETSIQQDTVIIKKEKAIKFENLIFDKDKLSDDEKTINQTKVVGKIITGKRWQDANGMNIVFFSQKEIKKTIGNEPDRLMRKLHVYHFAKQENDSYKLIREVKDATTECGFENRAKFDTQNIAITDIDKNSFGEITFTYRLGCSSELSPDGLKLIMLENGKKFAIRGNTLVHYGPETFGGKTNIDTSFNNAPENFLKHAKGIWEKAQIHLNNDKPTKQKNKKTLLNAEHLSTHDWKLIGNTESAAELVPHTFRFLIDGTLKYSAMEEEWITIDWDMKVYPKIISPLSGKLTFEEGVLFYKVKSESGGNIAFQYK